MYENWKYDRSGIVPEGDIVHEEEAPKEIVSYIFLILEI
jgi:hypothetical protein